MLVSPHRTDRPWQGQREPDTTTPLPQHDPDCYLCPGNERAGGEQNPDYPGTWWFPNDFAALLPPGEGPGPDPVSDGVFRAEPVDGACRVLCFSPRHDLSLSRATPAQIRDVVDLWQGQYDDLADRWASVQIFENRGSAMGSSNPHPHGQLWATSVLPSLIRTEDENQARHLERHGSVLLLDSLAQELDDGSRVVVSSRHWVVVVPFWAVWPFETLLLPRRHVRRMTELDDDERDDLAEVMSRLLVRYDNLFSTPFPYSMGWHVAPGIEGGDHWQMHAHFYPPLLRSSTVRKFMVGFELLAEQQRDISPERAAARLLAVDDQHYADLVTPS